jgi:hypothetical protein
LKTDYFAEFRRRHFEDKGYTGYAVTYPEKPTESMNYPSGSSVTDDSLGSATGLQIQTDPIRNPRNPVAQRAGYESNQQELKQEPENYGRVTRVTHVIEKSRKAAEKSAQCIPPIDAEPNELEREAGREHHDDYAPENVKRTSIGNTPQLAIDPAVEAEIRRVECDALQFGWSHARLWNVSFWPHSPA